ncbi:MFS transporter [Streptomyces litchfieldiae]|uniref:MFS transporter n=1 Tax=Streptomyces litchfieldiae TaxID=3075543 RepID=A0ABU2MV57_9ACTN|nr:MFS transporter [Streptomyces sp. DSM 44938]MDT0345178.1 MFS transporter [Streptomyces sp. DSM 44938]
MTAPDTGGRRALAGLLSALVLANTGTGLAAIALPWFVLVSSGSAVLTGLVAFAEIAPYVLVKALAGPLVDRLGPRVVSWTTDLVSAAAVGLVPLLHAAGLLPFGLLLPLVALVGAARGPGDLAKQIMVPEAAERGGVPLERATGLSGVIERLASTIGPAAGGALVALLGAPTTLGVNALCFVTGSLVIAATLPVGMGRGAAGGTGEAEGGGYWRRFGDGLAFVRADRLLLTIVLMVAVTNMLDTALNTLLLPVWARESGAGPSAIGLLTAVGGATAVCGSLIATATAHRLRRRPVFFAGFLIASAPRFVVLAGDTASGLPRWTVIVIFGASGFGAGFLNPILSALLFERVPRALRGRVMGLTTAAAWSCMPFGGLLAGAAVSGLGLAPALLTAGTVYFLTIVLAGLRPEWREMDRGRGRARGPAQPPTGTAAAVAAEDTRGRRAT